MINCKQEGSEDDELPPLVSGSSDDECENVSKRPPSKLFAAITSEAKAKRKEALITNKISFASDADIAHELQQTMIDQANMNINTANHVQRRERDKCMWLRAMEEEKKMELQEELECGLLDLFYLNERRISNVFTKHNLAYVSYEDERIEAIRKQILECKLH